MLAMVIDDSIINWIGGLAAVSLPIAGTAIWACVKKLTGWLRPKIDDAFNAHKDFIVTTTSQVPIVVATLKKLGDTQEKQCETLEQHSKLLDGHTTKLSELINEVKHNRCTGTH